MDISIGNVRIHEPDDWEDGARLVINTDRGKVFGRVGGEDGDCIWIENIVVYEDYRRKGIGTILLQLIEERAKVEGAKFIRAAIVGDNTLEFWEKQGFKEEGTIDELNRTILIKEIE